MSDITSITPRTMPTRPRGAVIWGVVMAIVVVLGLIAVVRADAERQRVLSQTDTTQARLAHALGEQIGALLREEDHTLRTLRQAYLRTGKRTDVREFVDAVAQTHSPIRQLGVIDERGLYALSSLPRFRAVDLADRDYFQWHRLHADDVLRISAPIRDRVTGQLVILMTRRITLADGGFGGVVVGALDPAAIGRRFEDLTPGLGGAVLMTGEDGLVRARVPLASNDSAPPSPAALDKIGDAGVLRQPISTGGVMRWAFRRVPGLPLYVAIGQDEDALLADVRIDVYAHAIGIVVIALAILGLGFAGLRYRETRVTSLRDGQDDRRAMLQAERARAAFLASLSHELRTPLNGIIGYAEVLGDEIKDPIHRDFARTIYKSSNHILELVRSILDLTQAESGDITLALRDESCVDLMREACVPFERLARRKGLRLAVDPSPDAPAVLRCDRERVLQVLHHLVHNAIKFTRQGTITLRAELEGNDVRFTVRDTGPGIAPERRDAIFEAYRQRKAFASENASGAGLGLALSRQLVERMGGQIGVESTPGSGSVFYFNLPVIGMQEGLRIAA